MDDNDLIFADEDEDDDDAPREAPWQVLIVDDEPQVHDATRLALRSFAFRNRRVEFLSAYSAAEGEAVLRRNPDVAVVFLDVVMETDDAGLRLVERIRTGLHNAIVRIILRTGQPGQAPEEDVIVNYDINDYKAKTELTTEKLFTVTVAALRSYQDLVALDLSRRGLRNIIEASASLFQQRSLRQFNTGVLTQLSGLLNCGREGILCAARGDTRGSDPDEFYILAGAGEFEKLVDRPLTSTVDRDVAAAIRCAVNERHNIYEPNYSVLYIEPPNHRELAVYLNTGRFLSELDRSLIEVFCSNITIGYENIHLYEKMKQLYEQLKIAHEATIVVLADLCEYKDNDTGDHVMRVARMSGEIARVLRDQNAFPDHIDDNFVEQVATASILHDIGKVGTPDRILQKPGQLTDEERAVMQQHTTTGGNILNRACRMLDGKTYLSLGREIAFHHHERFDGSGYPSGLVGDDIPLAARIVSVTDVFDALTSKRPYKDPWPRDKAIDYVRERAGSHFDPRVVNAFLTVMAVRSPESESG